jgi:hypothetical protein
MAHIAKPCRVKNGAVQRVTRLGEEMKKNYIKQLFKKLTNREFLVYHEKNFGEGQIFHLNDLLSRGDPLRSVTERNHN